MKKGRMRARGYNAPIVPLSWKIKAYSVVNKFIFYFPTSKSDVMNSHWIMVLIERLQILHTRRESSGVKILHNNRGN